MQPLLRIIDPQMIQSGTFPSLAPVQLALWREASNVLFYDGGAQKTGGIGSLGTAFDGISQLAQAFVDGQKRIYYGTPTRLVAVTDGVPQTLGSSYGGNRWSFVPWGNWLLATNDVDPVQVWKNTGFADDLAGVPITHARIIRKLDNFPIIYSGQSAYWPTLTDIESWTPGPESRAGQMFLRDLDSDIQAVEPLGSGLIVYTQNKALAQSFVGGTDVFGFQPLLEGIGTMSRNGIVPTGRLHYGLSRDGIWMTDGTMFDYVDQPAVNRLLDADIDWLYARDVRGFHLKDQATVMWFYRAIDGDTHGIGFNYETKAWSPMELDIDAVLPQEVYDKPLAASGTAFGQFGASPNMVGEGILATLKTVALDVGSPHEFKRWGLVRVFREGTGTVQIRFGYSDTEDATPDWSDWQTLARENWIDRESVFLTIEFRSLATDVTWRIGGFEVHGEMTGAVT